VIYDSITDLIGNTPLLRLPAATHTAAGLPAATAELVDVHAKLELLNPFGSVKDRIAWGMLRPVLDDVRAAAATVVESSSGNTATALQVLCSVHGVPFRTVTNRIKVEESRDLLLTLGAEVRELPGSSDCHDPTDPNDPVLVIEREVAGAGGRLHHTSQYTNPANVEAHHATGEEIAADLPRVDLFVAGLGTTGSSRGIAERLRVDNPGLTVVGVVTRAGDHIPGLRTADELFEVGLFDRRLYDDVVTVTSAQAADAMLLLARTAGLMAGPSTGAAYTALAATLGQNPVVAPDGARAVALFLACDRLEGYLSWVRARRPELFGLPTSLYAVRGVDAVDPTVTLPVEEVDAWLAHGPALVVDTRSALGFAAGHLPGAVNIPDHALELVLEDGLPFADDARVLLTCAVGERSARYATVLRETGVDARSLQGGVTGWRDAGMPVQPSRTLVW